MGFLESTRQNLYPLTKMDYESKREVSCDISRVGFLSRVSVRFNGKLNAKHATKTTFTPAFAAPWNIANNISLILNNGTALWRTSGYGAYLQNVMNKMHYSMDKEIVGSNVYKFGHAVSAAGVDNDISFTLDLNVSVNDRDCIGLFLLQSNNVVCTLKVDNADPSALLSATDNDIVTTLKGTWTVTMETFEVPNDVKSWPALNVAHCVQEEKINLTGAGENKLALLRGNIYMRLINQVVLNGAPAASGIDTLALKYNTHTEPYKMYVEDMLALQRQRYSRDLPTGVFAWDFFYQGEPNLGNQRDFVDTSEIAEFDELITLASTATLGTNNNYVLLVRDMLMPVTPVQ